MNGVIVASIAAPANDLVVLDATRRLYVGLSRDGSYYHVIRPLRDHDARVRDQADPARAGDLACNCAGGENHGHCYQLARAIAFEGARAAEVIALEDLTPAWERGLDSPAGAGEAVEAFRG